MAGKRSSLGARIGIVLGCVAVAVLGVAVFLKISGASTAVHPEPDAGASASASSGSASQGASSAGAASSAAGSSASSAAFTGMLQGSGNTGKEGNVYGQLKSVEYSDSGDMMGSLYAVSASRGDDGAVVVKVRKSKMHSDPIEVGEYRASDDLLDRIAAVIDREGMKEWGELPQSEFIALDAATEVLRMEFESVDPNDKWPEWLTYSENDELPEGGLAAFREINDLMMAETGAGNLIREYVE